VFGANVLPPFPISYVRLINFISPC